MLSIRERRSPRTILALIVLCCMTVSAQGKYGGGSGTADEPYQIWTAEQMNAIGAEPNDWDKHFKLMADVDLSAYDGSEGRPAFQIIALETNSDRAGPPQDLFTGVFDGNGHTIANFTLTAIDQYPYAGLFGYVGGPRGEIRNLGLIHAVVKVGDAWSVGALAGSNGGSIIHCYSTGVVSGKGNSVGGLVGYNLGQVTGCYSGATVDGDGIGASTGGLVGGNDEGMVAFCYSSGAVHGRGSYAGGLVGNNLGAVTHCYSISVVRGGTSYAGGLAGFSRADAGVNGSFWDVETSGQAPSAQSAGRGLTTAQMQNMQTYLDAGWDWAGRAEDGTCEVWQMPAAGGYPVLAFFQGYTPPRLQGEGSPDKPYLISNASELGAMHNYRSYAHYRLAASIDLSGIRWGTAVIPSFAGVFDGDGRAISHLTIAGDGYLGLFGRVAHGAEVRDLAVTDVNVAGTDWRVGALTAGNGGAIIHCYTTGSLKGNESVGGLVGNNGSWGTVTQCYSTAAVDGKSSAGALLGENWGVMTHCYSSGPVTIAGKPAGGSVTSGWGTVIGCFGESSNVGGPARRRFLGTAAAAANPMHDKQTYLAAGWDWVGETTNGTSEVWQMPEGGGHPVLSMFGGYTPPQLSGRGTAEDPYLVSDAGELGAVVHYGPCAHYRLDAPIDLSGTRWAVPVIPSFAGTFDGAGLTISHLTVTGGGHLGLFGQVVLGAKVRDLRIVDANITGTEEHVGGLAGFTDGEAARCYSTGTIKGAWSVGGLIGHHGSGDVADCRSTSVVTGTEQVGGLLGYNAARVTRCDSANLVSGQRSVGGLVGSNGGSLDSCRNAATVYGAENVGGLIGDNFCGHVTHCGNNGTVDGGQSVGGLAGNSRDEWDRPSSPGAVVDCYNAGLVNGLSQVGGLIGSNSDVIDNCYNAGSVSGETYVGGMVGVNSDAMTRSHSDGAVNGSEDVGGLAGANEGAITECSSAGKVTGDANNVGGLVGRHWIGATISNCCSRSSISGDANNVGGLVGANWAGNMTNSYSTSTITGGDYVGGLIGIDYRVLQYAYNPDAPTLFTGAVSRCYFAGRVSGGGRVGGFVGAPGSVFESYFWDRQVSGLAEMFGEPDPEAIGCDDSYGKTTAEVQTARTFLDAGWDFVDETANGTEDIWTICEGRDYPRLRWEQIECEDSKPPVKTVFYPDYVVLADYGKRTFQWTHGPEGQWISEVAGAMTVNYDDGTSLMVTEMTNTSFSNGRFWNEMAYNDGVTTGLVAIGDYRLSLDPDLAIYPGKWSFGPLTDGMRVDVSPYYLVRMDGMQPPIRIDFKVLLYEVQDVNILHGHYADAAICWNIDTRYPYVPLNFSGKDADLGIVLPAAFDTGGHAITNMRIRGFHTDIIAIGEVDPRTGQLLYLGELKRIESP